MPTLGYWKTKLLAQPIRLLLTYAGEEFEDVMYEMGDGPEFSKVAWLKDKANLGDVLDFPDLPYFIDGDVKITQSNAILRYVARKHGLEGHTTKEKAEVDMLIETAMDFRHGIVNLCYYQDFVKNKDDYLKNVHSKLVLYEKKLGDNPWFAGAKLTAADFPFYEILDHHRRLQSDIFETYPRIQAFLSRFESLSRVKEYLTSDSVRNLPMNNKWAQFR